MNGFTKRGMTLSLAVLAAAVVGIAAASGCDSGLNRGAGAGQTADAARRFGCRYKIRGPKGWVACYFLSNLEDYVPGTDRTVHIEHYFRRENRRYRDKLEEQGITITGYHSTSKVGEYCWLEFNMKEITAIKTA